MEHQRSLNMQLPRGWYQVAGVSPHTFRRHGLATASGKLQLTLLLPPDEPVADGESALAMLRHTLAHLDIAVGTPLENGHESCAAGLLAHATYQHVGGQREYWIIPSADATVFASWEMGAKATAGMERREIHDMLKRLYFELHEESGAEEDANATHLEASA
jgi:hypothetical protein